MAMSTSDIQLQIENEYPAQFVPAFLEAISTRALVLQLKNYVDDTPLTCIIPFLNAHPTVTTLNVSYSIRLNDIMEAFLIALEKHQTLTTLNISGNRMGIKGATALSRNQKLTTLIAQHNVSSEQEGLEIAKILAKSETLTTLDLSCNNIGDEEAIALSENSTFRTLILRRNRIGVLGATALSKQEALTDLDLSENCIEDRGAMAFAENPTLKTLKLKGCRIGMRGAIALSHNKALLKLDLGNNHIEDKGLMAIANNHPTLMFLEARYNYVGDPDVVKAILKNPTLMEVDLCANQLSRSVHYAFVEAERNSPWFDFSHFLTLLERERMNQRTLQPAPVRPPLIFSPFRPLTTLLNLSGVAYSMVTQGVEKFKENWQQPAPFQPPLIFSDCFLVTAPTVIKDLIVEYATPRRELKFRLFQQ